jgi:glutamate:Na+ symporter, ESS family
VTSFALSPLDTLLVALTVLLVGRELARRLPALDRSNVPHAVVGGVLCALVVLGLREMGGIEVRFASDLRDVLLLAFFATIGLTGRLRLLMQGGRPFLVVCGFTVALLVVQNAVGVAMALGFDLHPFLGLQAGSVSFVGGPGTAAAWGKVGAEMGIAGAMEVGLACATIALVAGGVVAAPVTGWLIERHRLRSATAPDRPHPLWTVPAEPPERRHIRVDEILGTMLVLALCVAIGSHVNDWLRPRVTGVPGFLTAMLVAIVVTNLADALRLRISEPAVEHLGELSLELFLAMSLMSIQLWTVARLAGPIAIISVVQIVLTCGLCAFVLFRWLGRDYDAAVTVGGVIGFGVASMPVAMATMDNITARYGPSPRALLTISLAGAFFVDFANAFVIQSLLALPLFR